MNDTPGFTPVEPTPHVPSSPATWAPPAAIPDPVGQWPTPPRRGLRGIAIAGIAIGAVVLVGSVAAAGVALAMTAATVAEEATEATAQQEESSPVRLEMLERGEKGSPVALEPLVCPGDVCFDDGAFRRLTPGSGDLREIGLTEQIGAYGEYPTSTEQFEFVNARDWWTEQENTPDDCFVTAFERPVALDREGGTASPEDPIELLAEYGDESGYSYFAQSVQLFPTSADAASHMSRFDTLLSGCTSYFFEDQYGSVKTSVRPAPAIPVAGSVAAIGWTEHSVYGRYYAFDIQRGNVVVRTVLSTDGVVTEADYRRFVETVADELAGLDTLG